MSLQTTPHGYSFIPGVFQYSAGVVAQAGYRIKRVTLQDTLPLNVGFDVAAEYLKRARVPLTAFCACELRSPEPFSETGFGSFNEDYVKILSQWGVLQGNANPVARSNVCPLTAPPAEPSLYAFSYCVAAEGTDRSFVVSGGAEAQEGGDGTYQDKTVCLGDVSPTGIMTKAKWVANEMERRMALLGRTWSETTAVQLYCIHDIHQVVERELAPRGVLTRGINWHLNRPPVEGLEFEMDCRGVYSEDVIPVEGKKAVFL